jgi:hypothetical protein
MTVKVYPINPFYAPEHPPLERLRCRVDYEMHMDSFEIAPHEWRGSEYWFQLTAEDEKRLGLSVKDMPRIHAIFTVFDALLEGGDHYISGDRELVSEALKAMPWFNPRLVSDDDFGRFAELMGADRRKAAAAFRKYVQFCSEAAAGERLSAPDDHDIPF